MSSSAKKAGRSKKRDRSITPPPHASANTTSTLPPPRQSKSAAALSKSSTKAAATAAAAAAAPAATAKTTANSASVAASHSGAISASKQSKESDLPASAGYLISCDVPTKQFIQYLNELKPVDKKFILSDLDATHLLVKRKAKDEIEQKIEAWMNDNVFSAVERVGEDLAIS